MGGKILDGRSEIKEGMENKENENRVSQSVVEEITSVGSQPYLSPILLSFLTTWEV